MSTDIDWQRELDSSFGAGHDMAPGHYVAAGRTAVRRRRRATAVVLTAAVVVAGGTAWAVAPGGTTRSEAPIATSGPAPTDDPQTRSERKERRERLRELRDAAADREKPEFFSGPSTLDSDGLVLAPGAGPVLQRVANPMGYTADQGQSLAIRVMFEDREKYVLMTRTPDASTSVGTNDASGDFAGWLAGRVQSQRTLDVANGVTDGPPGPPETDPSRWLRLQEDGDVVGAGDVVLLEVDADPALADFRRGADRTGAVRVLVDERPRFAAYRVIDGELEVIAAPGSFDSMSAFLDWARQQYASGEGMR